MAELKFRNAFLKGWFAARARRPLPETDGMAEKVYIDHGFEAGSKSGGRALDMITSKLEPAALPSVNIVIGPEKVKPAKAEPVKPEPETAAAKNPKPESAKPAEPEVKTPKSEEVEAEAPEAEPSPDEDDEDAPKKNVFLPDRKPGSSTPKTKPRFGR